METGVASTHYLHRITMLIIKFHKLTSLQTASITVRTKCMYLAVVRKTLCSAMTAYRSRIDNASAKHSEASSKSVNGT